MNIIKLTANAKRIEIIKTGDLRDPGILSDTEPIRIEPSSAPI